ncbi:DprA-like protein [Bacillus phage vB_BceM-HSE3]|nr:DprA-like protein [Bacillus phage vB_BceM-HSE3]
MLDFGIIGTRNPSQSQFELAKNLSYYLISHGFLVSTGGAKGIDEAAMEGALLAGAPERCTVYLPWKSYNEELVRDKGFQLEILNPDGVKEHYEWLKSVDKYHPNPTKLRKGGKLLHARNFGIIKDTTKVYACPSPKGGGTAQGMRIAKDAGIPLIDFSDATNYTKLSRVIEPYIKTFPPISDINAEMITTAIGGMLDGNQVVGR